MQFILSRAYQSLQAWESLCFVAEIPKPLGLVSSFHDQIQNICNLF